MEPYISMRWAKRIDKPQWANGDYMIFGRDREGPLSSLEVTMRFEARNMVLDLWLGEYDTWGEADTACREHAENYQEARYG
jgi:hypothetical protein